jgi:hypothetical protein
LVGINANFRGLGGQINVYKLLDTDLLELTGWQSEVIEIAMTYGFSGINVDMVDLSKRCQRSSFENAARFLLSSRLRIGSFRSPISLDDDDTAFANNLEQLKQIAIIAGQCKASAALLDIPAGTNRLPYPEYFEVVRKRIDQIAELLATQSIRLALRLNAIGEVEEKQFKFVREIDGFSALVRSCTSRNVAIALDTWNWHLGSAKPQHLDAIGLDRVALVYLADCKEGVDAAAATAEDRLLPGATCVIDNVQWLKQIGNHDLPVAAYGAAPSATLTRDAFIASVQDSLNDTLLAAGIVTSSRKPGTLATAGARDDSEDSR